MPATIYRLCLFALVCIAVLSPSASYAQGKITLQRDGQFTYYPSDSLQAALDDAQDGDIVLLPGGSFTGSFTLNTRISLIGVGFDPDSSSATSTSVITGVFFLGEGASNSYLTGINFGSYIYGIGSSTRVDNVIIHRCIVGGAISQINTSSSNWIISESVLSDIFGMNSCRVSNCIIENRISGHTSAIIENCIFLENVSSIIAINACANCIVQGCIFSQINGQIYGASSNWAHAANNVFVGNSPGTYVTNVQNVLNASQGSLFVNYNGQSSWNLSLDFHLAPNSPAIGSGPGGTDCGIYGGPSPWKEGSVPITPHIQEQIIGTTTSPTGGLPVQIRVSAQDR